MGQETGKDWHRLARRRQSFRGAQESAEQARDGINPKLKREQVSASSRSAPLFKDFAGMICDQVVAGRKGEKSKEKWRRCIHVYSAALHKLPIDQIGVDDVLNILLPIWRSKPVAARETRAHLQHVFGAAKAMNHIDRGKMNPATWEDNLKHLLPKQPKSGSMRGKHKSLPYDEMPAFMAELRAMKAQSARMLEICILTCVRTIEVIQMRWEQINWKRGRWVIPGKVMKNTLEADIPLTDTVLAILREIKEIGLDNKLVFPGLKRGQTCSNNTMLKLLKVDMGRNATVHGFRSCFRTWAAERTTFAREVVEAALAHVVGNETERAYQRGDLFDKRRRLMTAWADYCAQHAAEVIPIRA